MSKAQGAASETEKPRTSVSGVVLPDEQVSASHTITLAELPPRVLDRLLSLGNDLPVSHGEDAVAQALVDGLSLLVPGHAVVVSIGQKIFREGARESFAPQSREVETKKRVSEHAIERVVRIPESAATLTIAGDDAQLAEDSAVPVQVAHRALFVLENALARARLLEENARLRASIEEHGAMLLQSNKLASLGQLAAGMVHEINNPLTSIVAYTDFLSKRAAAREDADDVERLRRIAESAHRMLRLSRDIVSYARPSSSIAQPVILSGVLEQALGFCEHLFEESGVTVERTFGDGVLPVRGHPEQLAQVFVNLFTNACHAMPDGGGKLKVVTELSPDEGRVRIVVSDNGHGISSTNLARVFLPFFTTKEEGRGTGLGLAIVKRIVESHDGEVEVESDEAGTRFAIHLPVAGEGRLSST
ncbi:MAG TPA: ATP-binding protein [Polyangiaceae bacterium]|jgi:signal transduction histidine kinase